MHHFSFLYGVILLFLSHTAVSQTVTGFHKRFSGFLNKNVPIVLELTRMGDELSGFYYYTKVGAPLRLAGKKENDKWIMNEYASNQTNTGIFEGALQSNKIVGVWKTPKGDRQYPFEVQEDYTSGSMPFEVYHLEGQERLFADMESPDVNFQLNISFPQSFDNQAILKKIRDRIIQELDIKGKTDLALPEAMREAQKEYFARYRADMESVKKEDFTGDEAVPTNMYSYSYEKNIKVDFNENGILSLAVYSYEYLGGAHGLPSASFLVFDLRTGNELTIKDLFLANANVRTQLENLINQQFRLDNQIATKTTLTEFGLSTDKIPLSENFYIEKAGIGFFYNVYEIAPYAAGQVYVVVPYQKLKPLLKPNHPLSSLVK